ncbi:MAG: AbrB/MazE/SpoVT family DNA-binding domain-containing protein [Anaerolineaceae bacterium]|nr:AbrB/MazE/SpoVT family DNA-binding domain-containing protein [Anaerolineaceae bacterium]
MEHITRVFTNGRSQAVRIPKQYRFDTDEVFINKIGEVVVLTPVSALAESFDKGLRMFSEDFLKEIPESMPSERPEL